MEQAAAVVEDAARGEGYTPVEGGLFWNAEIKRLYVKSGDHYVLYSFDRREDAPAPAGI